MSSRSEGGGGGGGAGGGGVDGGGGEGGGGSGTVKWMLTYSQEALSALASKRANFSSKPGSFFVITPATLKKLTVKQVDDIKAGIDGQYRKLREADGLGTGNVVVDASKVWLQEKQNIGGRCVGEGKEIPKFTLLSEYVGHVVTEDESRRSASTHMYDLSLPWPTKSQTPELMMDAETSERAASNGELLSEVTCIAAKLNDPKIIQERPEGPTDDSNGEGHSQFVACSMLRARDAK